MTSENHKLAAILFADIQGYTTLMQENEQLALSALQKFKRTLETIVPTFHGEIIQFYGDGCLVTFNSSIDAVNAGWELQKVFQTKPKVPIRIGIHSGDAVFRDGNVFGDAVNIASRVESMSVPGAVLVSGNVRNQIKNKPVFKLINLGQFEFKNVTEQINVYALGNEGLVIPPKEGLEGKFQKTAPPQSTKKSPPILLFLLGFLSLAMLFLLVNFWSNGNKIQQGEMIEVSNEEGKKIKTLLPALQQVKTIASFQFENLTGEEEQDWWGIAFSLLLRYTLEQHPEYYTFSQLSLDRYYNGLGLESFTIPNIGMQREIAQKSRHDYFTRIAFSIEEDKYIFKGNLYSSKDGKSIMELMTSNTDPYAAIDEIKQQIVENIPNASKVLEQQVNLPASTLITNNTEALKQYILARIAYYKNRGPNGIEESLRLLKKSIETAPTCAFCHFYTGDALYKLGRKEEAIPYIKNSIKYGSSLPKRMQFGPKGVLHTITNNMEAYIKLQELRRKMFPYDFYPYSQLLTIYRANYGIDSAKVLLQEAIDNGNIEKGLLALYDLQIENEEYKEAEKSLNQLNNQFPNRDQDKIKYATIYEKQGRMTEAKEILLDLEANDPLNSTIQTNLAYLDFKNLAIAQAMERVEQGIQQSTTLTDSLNFIWIKSFFFQMCGQIEQAKLEYAEYEKYASKRTPLNQMIEVTFTTKSALYLTTGQPEKVDELLINLGKYSPESVQLYKCLAEIIAISDGYKMQLNQEEFEACKSIFLTYGDGYGEYFDVYTFFRAKDYVHCVKILEADNNRVKKLFSGQRFLATIYAKAGAIEKAKEILEKAINQKTDEPSYYYQLAVLLEKEDPQTAKANLKIALQYWANADKDYIPLQRAKDLANRLPLN